MKIKLLDYESNEYELDVDEENLDHLEVEVISGDEILSIYLKDGSIETYDAADYLGQMRMMNFYDGWYEVYPEDIEKWMNRKDSYDWPTETIYEDD